MNTPAFPGYPIEVVDRFSVPKHPLLYPIRVLYSGEIIIDRPFESTHPVHRSQVVNLEDILEDKSSTWMIYLKTSRQLG